MNTSHVLSVVEGVMSSVMEVNYSYAKERLKLQQFLSAAIDSQNVGGTHRCSGWVAGWMDYRYTWYVLNPIISITDEGKSGTTEWLKRLKGQNLHDQSSFSNIDRPRQRNAFLYWLSDSGEKE